MTEEKEELDIQETRRLIGPNSYDDNYNLVNYTSELVDNNGNFFSVPATKADVMYLHACTSSNYLITVQV